MYLKRVAWMVLMFVFGIVLIGNNSLTKSRAEVCPDTEAIDILCPDAAFECLPYTPRKGQAPCETGTGGAALGSVRSSGAFDANQTQPRIDYKPWSTSSTLGSGPRVGISLG